MTKTFKEISEAVKKAKGVKNQIVFHGTEGAPQPENKPVKEEIEQVEEKLTPAAGAGKYIKDFQASTDTEFAGKSKEKRRTMALAAFMQAKRKVSEEVEQIDEVVDSSDYKAHSEPSQFGGHRPVVTHKAKGHTMYAGQHRYDSAEKATAGAHAYLKAYSERGDHSATRAAHAHAKEHGIKESVEMQEEKQIEVTMKSGHKFTAPVKMTSKDWHIVKHPTSGKQYRVDHSGKTLDEEFEIQESSDHDPDVHVYSGKKHLGTKKLSAANKEHGTNISKRDVGVGSHGIDTHVGSSSRLAHHPDPKARQVRYVHASHAISEEVEQIEERNKENAIKRKMMDASRGAKHKLNNPVPDRDPEHKTAQAQNKAIGRALRNEEEINFDAEGNLMAEKKSYTEFMSQLLEYEVDKNGRYVHKGNYGSAYKDPEGADDADDKPKKAAGRKVGSKVGPKKNLGNSKLHQK